MSPSGPLAMFLLLLQLPFCVLFSPALNHPVEPQAGTPTSYTLDLMCSDVPGMSFILPHTGRAGIGCGSVISARQDQQVTMPL